MHQVVEERRREAVREVSIIREDDLRPLGWHVSEERHEPRVRLLGEARHLRRQRVLALMEVDLEMRRIDREPHVPRIESERGGREQQGANESAAHQEPAARSRAGWIPASHFSSRSVTSSGCSSVAMCDPPGTVSISARWMRSYICSESQYGVKVSCVPATISTGTSTFAR